jgi:hypothetical protein
LAHMTSTPLKCTECGVNLMKPTLQEGIYNCHVANITFFSTIYTSVTRLDVFMPKVALSYKALSFLFGKSAKEDLILEALWRFLSRNFISEFLTKILTDFL